MKKKHLGVDYCDDVWISEFAKMQKYDPSKGCNVQHNHIIEKEFYFQHDIDPDQTITSGMGVWAYVHEHDLPINILHLLPPTPTPRYRFGDIIQFFRNSFLFDKYTNINVIDCTCSVITGNPPRDASLDRTQRKLQRRLVSLPPPIGGWNKRQPQKNPNNKTLKKTQKKHKPPKKNTRKNIPDTRH
jgi:hypothetical protein